MQLFIKIHLDEPLELPINYNHIVQGILYNSIGGHTDLSTFVHETGFQRGKRSFRPFVFSLLSGPCRVRDRRITFYESVDLEVRSPDVLLLDLMADNLAEKGIRFGDRLIEDVSISMDDLTVEEEQIFVRMKSPVVARYTDPERGEHYCDPSEPEFTELLAANFRRKYTAFYRKEPASQVFIQPWQITPKDKFVTRFQRQYITGWNGVYQLVGERKYLDFLYQIGLGSKNAQGFGMFYILE